MAKPILKAVHETAKGLRKAGIMATKTMHDFDVLCLPPVKSNRSNQTVIDLRARCLIAWDPARISLSKHAV